MKSDHKDFQDIISSYELIEINGSEEAWHKFEPLLMAEKSKKKYLIYLSTLVGSLLLLVLAVYVYSVNSVESSLVESNHLDDLPSTEKIDTKLYPLEGYAQKRYAQNLSIKNRIKNDTKDGLSKQSHSILSLKQFRIKQTNTDFISTKEDKYWRKPILQNHISIKKDDSHQSDHYSVEPLAMPETSVIGIVNKKSTEELKLPILFSEFQPQSLPHGHQPFAVLFYSGLGKSEHRSMTNSRNFIVGIRFLSPEYSRFRFTIDFSHSKNDFNAFVNSEDLRIQGLSLRSAATKLERIHNSEQIIDIGLGLQSRLIRIENFNLYAGLALVKKVGIVKQSNYHLIEMTNSYDVSLENKEVYRYPTYGQVSFGVDYCISDKLSSVFELNLQNQIGNSKLEHPDHLSFRMGLKINI